MSGDLKCIAFADGNCPNWFPLSPPLAASASEDCQTWDAMQCGMRWGVQTANLENNRDLSARTTRASAI